MKIVIDVPEEEYKDALRGVFNITAFNEAISKRSTPLEKVFEDIKAEIKDESRFIEAAEGLERALEIIDEHIGEEQ